MSGLAAACWAACTALELKARCARDVPFAFTVVFRVATIRSRPDAVGKGTLLLQEAYYLFSSHKYQTLWEPNLKSSLFIGLKNLREIDGFVSTLKENCWP